MSARPASSALFTTDHGSARWASDGRLTLSIGDQSWTVQPTDMERLHKATEALAGQVYRCNCDCRWQLRLGGQSPAVLSTDEVLQLHSLLSGTAVMLELRDMLEDAMIAVPEKGSRPTTQA